MCHHENVRCELCGHFHGWVGINTGIVDGRLNRFAEVHHHLFFVGAAGIREELVDDVFHLLKVTHHGLTGVLRQMGSQFNFQTQACDRRTQVVRDAGQKQFSVGLHVREIFHHTVETHIDCLNLRGGSVFWERFRFDAFTHLIGKVGQFGKGLHHMTSKQCGAKERSQPSGHSPP